MARDADPIDLAGWSVRVWQDGARTNGSHLAGQAAVLQGVDGLRADEAVVRVVDESSNQGQAFRIEVYAESLVPRATAPQGKATPADRKPARGRCSTATPRPAPPSPTKRRGWPAFRWHLSVWRSWPDRA